MLQEYVKISPVDSDSHNWKGSHLIPQVWLFGLDGLLIQSFLSVLLINI